MEPGGRSTHAPATPAPPTARLTGLTDGEVLERRRRGEGNRAAPSAGRTYLQILVEGAFAPVNIVLFGTCLVLVWLGLGVDAAVTAVPVLLNVIASVGLEARAKRQLDGLTILSRPRARVIRTGAEREVVPEELVLGDLLVVARGDQVILDGDVVDGAVELDESLLTGEADPVTRRAGDRILSGTACLGGRAVMRVTAVGRGSYAASLVARAREARSERTPLQRDLARLVGGSAALVLAVGIVVAVDFAGAGELLSRAAVQAAAVLVAIVPQGLVIISTLLYATAAVAMGRSGALVQRVTAVEAMSRADTLVLDKTGTLTTGRLRLARTAALETMGRQGAEPAPADGPAFGAEPAGAAPPGPEAAEAEPSWTEPSGAVRDLLAALAAEPSFTDRTIEAVRRWLAAYPGRTPTATARVHDRVPFSSDRRWSAVFTDRGAVILGAPEALLGEAGVPAAIEAWAARGLRLLVVGSSPASAPTGGERPALPRDVRPVAVLGFEEELRPDARDTLAGLLAAGLSLKIASGDHRVTVGAIAAAVGIRTGEPVDGARLAEADDAALAQAGEAGTVFGRVEPGLKARLIGVLRRRGHDVAMIGDGVNDIIALRAANLGLAMASGSPAARAAADVVLLRDEFAVLPRAITAGQRIVEGMRLVACLLFTRTVYALVIVLVAAVAGLEFPVTPRTNSVQALLTVGIPSLVLAAWAPAVPARTRLVRSALRFAVPAGLAIAVLGLAVYALWPRGEGGAAEARTALTAITTWCGILLIPFLLPPGASRDTRPTFLAAVMALAFAVVLAVPALRELFELDALTIPEIAVLGLLGAGWAMLAYRVRSLRLVARLLRAARRVTG